MEILAHLCSHFVTKSLAPLPKLAGNSPSDEVTSPSEVNPASTPSAPALAPKFLPLAWILDPDKKGSHTDRILAQLALAESKENNAHFRDDYRQAFICVSLAAKGENIPFIQSSYLSYGIHPDKVWPAIIARRKASYGKLYGQYYDANDLAIPSPAGENLRHSLPGLSQKVESQILPRLVHAESSAESAEAREEGRKRKRETNADRLANGDIARQTGRAGLPLEPAETPSAGQRCDAASNLVPSQPIKKPSQSIGRQKEEGIA